MQVFNDLRMGSVQKYALSTINKNRLNPTLLNFFLARLDICETAL